MPDSGPPDSGPPHSAAPPEAYLALEGRFRRLGALGEASAILGWDLAVMMPAGSGPARGEHWSGVLLLPEREIAVSGTVDGSDGTGVTIRLDLLIDDYNRAIEDHLTRLQMLDFVL